MKKFKLLLIVLFILMLASGCESAVDSYLDSYDAQKQELKFHFDEEDTGGASIKQLEVEITSRADNHKQKIILYEGNAVKSYSGKVNVYIKPGQYDVAVTSTLGSGVTKSGTLDGYFLVKNYDESSCSGLSVPDSCLHHGCTYYEDCSGFTPGGGACYDVCTAFEGAVPTTTRVTTTVPIAPAPTTCEAIFGSFYKDLQQGVKAYKIIAPLLVLIYSVSDYLKAIFSKDAEGLKDANKKLIRRGILLVILFFLPTILDIMIHLLIGTEFGTCLG